MDFDEIKTQQDEKAEYEQKYKELKKEELRLYDELLQLYDSSDSSVIVKKSYIKSKVISDFTDYFRMKGYEVGSKANDDYLEIIAEYKDFATILQVYDYGFYLSMHEVKKYCTFEIAMQNEHDFNRTYEGYYYEGQHKYHDKEEKTHDFVRNQIVRLEHDIKNMKNNINNISNIKIILRIADTDKCTIVGKSEFENIIEILDAI